MEDVRFVEVPGGARLAVDLAPGGPPPFLLVHGLASNRLLWTGVARELHGRGYAVAAVDLRGHGRSSKPDGGYSFSFHEVTADLVAVIRRLGWDRAVVVGQSWGASVALELAARHPDVARGVACIDGGTVDLARLHATWEECEQALAPPSFEGVTADELERRVRAAHPDWPEAGVRGALACYEVGGDGSVAPRLTRDRHMRILRALWEQRPADLHRQVRVPVLLVPADDGSTGDWAQERRRSVAEAEAALARVRTVWLRGDHDLHAQHPVVVAEVLDACVREGFFP